MRLRENLNVLDKKTEKYKTFPVQIETEVTKID